MSNLTVPVALVVDDNFYNRDLCRMALEHVGYIVVEAENGREALATLANRSFNLLVLDLAMPEVDGLSVIREICDKTEHKKMQILVVTAHAHMSYNLIDVGADFIMHKPIDIEAFSRFSQRLIMTES